MHFFVLQIPASHYTVLLHDANIEGIIDTYPHASKKLSDMRGYLTLLFFDSCLSAKGDEMGCA